MYKIESPPRTIMEVYKSLPEGTLAELINGSIVMSPSPSPNHQRISRNISTVLWSFVEKNALGEVFYAPLDVFLDEGSNVVQPDIVFVSNDKAATIEGSNIHGAPDLLIEILSPGNSNHDRVTKKGLYERFGVKEYWIIDPETKESTGFVLNDNKFELVGRFHEVIRCVILDREFRFWDSSL